MSEVELFATKAHFDALQAIVGDWISEGFTTPPYTPEQYDIFEWLGLSNNDDPHSYDTRRPSEMQPRVP